MGDDETKIDPHADVFSDKEACRVCRLVMHCQGHRRIIIDLEQADDATTAAFARLVELRRKLLRAGRDLCLRGLHSRAAGLYEINHLDHILPQAD